MGKISKIGLKTQNGIVWLDPPQGGSGTNKENTRCVIVSKSSEIQNTHHNFRVVEGKIYGHIAMICC